MTGNVWHDLAEAAERGAEALRRLIDAAADARKESR